jgi:hypothetical protein
MIIAILLSFNCYNIVAQGQQIRPYKKNQFYLELGGNGIIYSLNYERLLSENFTLRGGIGYTPGLIFVEGTFIHIPFTASYLIGSSSSKFEMGLGFTYFTGRDVEIFGLEGGDKSVIVLTGIIGYRYVSQKGFVFRIAFTPFYNPNNTEDSRFLPSGGLSFGYVF